MKQLQAKIESQALNFAGMAAVVGAVVGLVWFWGAHPALFGRGSIANAGSVLAAVAAFTGFGLAYRRYRPPRDDSRRVRQALTDAALALTLAAICWLLTIVGFYVVQAAFVGVTLDQWASAALVGLTGGVAGYFAYLTAARLTTARLASILAVFMAAGGLASMITAPNPYWWQIHFSSLGGGHSASAFAFNATLLVGGLVIVGLSDFVASDLEKLKRPGLNARAIRWILAIMGLMLAGVGVFPYDTRLGLHNLCATGLSVTFIVLVSRLHKLAPGFPKPFYGFAYSLVAALLVGAWLYLGVGYLNLTTFELLATGLIFAWLLVFVRNIAAGTADAGQ
jgi:hypothetical membrane protein